MRAHPGVAGTLAALFGTVLAAVVLVAASPPGRPFTVQDAIELSAIVDFSASAEGAVPHPRPLVSPDGRFFLLLTERGDLAGDRIVSTIWLFDQQAEAAFLRHPDGAVPPAPRNLATLAATTNLPVISGARWLPDSARIAFLGHDGDPHRQLFLADVATGRRTALTGKDAFVGAYDIRGDTVAYTTLETDPPPAADGDGLVVATGRTLPSLLYPQPPPLADENWESLGSRAAALHVLRAGRELPVTFLWQGRPLRLFAPSWALAPPLDLAPDGSSLVTLAPVSEIPPGWEVFPPQDHMGSPRLAPGDRAVLAEDSFYKPLQFVRVDLATGLVSPLLDAPAARSFGYLAPTRAFWLAGGRQVLLTNTFVPPSALPSLLREHPRPRQPSLPGLPPPPLSAPSLSSRSPSPSLPAAAPAPRPRLAEPIENPGEPGSPSPVLALIDVATRRLLAIKPLPLTASGPPPWSIEDLAWDAERQEMTLTYGSAHQAPPLETWRLLPGGGWTRVPARTGGPPATAGLDLAVEEAIDRPPALTGRRAGEPAPAVLWDPNPQLAGVALGKASIYRWKDRDGTPWSGILALPPDFDPRRRYPLVLQTHGFNRDRFFVDGEYTTGSAGRALVARGVIVLQMDMPAAHLFTVADAPFQLGGFQSAVASLAAAGWVDPGRVGVIGFSFTCFHTLYALTHDPGLFAAAAVTDGNEMTYSQYLLGSGLDVDLQSFSERINGGVPWGEGLASWAARSPSFNFDKVTAPLLIAALERGSLLSQWEPYAVLRRLGKPVDLLWLRAENAEHTLRRPRHRQLSQQSAVDWFDFWLNGHQDPDPAKAPQYTRWRDLRQPHTASRP